MQSHQYGSHTLPDVKSGHIINTDGRPISLPSLWDIAIGISVIRARLGIIAFRYSPLGARFWIFVYWYSSLGNGLQVIVFGHLVVLRWTYFLSVSGFQIRGAASLLARSSDRSWCCTAPPFVVRLISHARAIRSRPPPQPTTVNP